MWTSFERVRSHQIWIMPSAIFSLSLVFFGVDGKKLSGAEHFRNCNSYTHTYVCGFVSGVAVGESLRTIKLLKISRTHRRKYFILFSQLSCALAGVAGIAFLPHAVIFSLS
jgi:hypothetical protein